LAEGHKIVTSLHFQFIFFLLGEKSLRIIFDFFCLIGEYQVYQEYQEYQEFTKNTKNTHEIASSLENTKFTKNTKNTHEIASLLVSCGYLFSYTSNWA